jgi:hypothetical protein
MNRLFALAFLSLIVPTRPVAAADWKPAAGPLFTRWAKEVSPANVHREYPRPQLVRPAWENLNGLWDYAIRPKSEDRPSTYDGKILVPFPVESALSGVMKRVGPADRLWYHRVINVPAYPTGHRLLLHFEAVDWEATVYVDGKEAGIHRGGYTPFSLDITELAPPGHTHDVVVGVWDPSDAGSQPRGKQQIDPHGIWYTPSTGIWQTAWLEPVPKMHIQDLYFQSGGAPNAVLLTVTAADALPSTHVHVDIYDRPTDAPGPKSRILWADGSVGMPLVITIPSDSTGYWTPETPQLYGAMVSLQTVDGKQVIDQAAGYFALRTIDAIAAPGEKTARIRLNGKPVFLIGTLDQGFWPDGLYTAPTDEALRSDLETTKKLGFNLVRKHVKVEPARWYYWCDRLGLLVFQDMPSGDKSAPEIHPKKSDPKKSDAEKADAEKSYATKAEITRTPESAKQFEAEFTELIASRRQFPSIIGWVAFNEGWGQSDTVAVVRAIKDRDPRRLVTPASGWNDFPVGDIHDIHRYPGPAAPPASAERAGVLGEFGGLGLPVPGHLWMASDKNWGYKRYNTREELTAAYLKLAAKLGPLVESGLSAAIYTQTTDVETEVNGLMTYDREVIKMDPEQIRQANTNLIQLPAGFAK